MNNFELILRIFEVLLQFILVILAWMALSVWKREIRGQEKYKLAKDLLSYIQELRFLIFYKRSGFCQIYLNDILVDRDKFYKDQLLGIKEDKVYFDQSIFGLFNHVDARSNIFLPKKIRSILAELKASYGEPIKISKQEHSYISLPDIKLKSSVDSEGQQQAVDSCLYLINNQNLTVQEYFKKWELLIRELKKIT
jgi:hypothetical protein